MYRIVFSNDAKKDLKELSKNYYQASHHCCDVGPFPVSLTHIVISMPLKQIVVSFGLVLLSFGKIFVSYQSLDYFTGFVKNLIDGIRLQGTSNPQNSVFR